MTSRELRQKYLDFFKTKNHRVISSASLIPENDPTVLFNTAGMQPLVPYLLGAKHPAGQRLASAQKCIRTIDIDEVGDNCHHTFFEMLGNWSLGDYFKTDSIKWSWEFLTSSQWLGLDNNLLAFSVFVGDEDAPFDEESYQLWQEMGVSPERIAKLPKADNWWGPAGQTGPCGPDTEIFYWTGNPKEVPSAFNSENKLWVEIWNNVFMEYNKTAEGKFTPLQQKNVDTGLGLERVVSVLNGLGDNYRTDLFINLIKKLEELSGQKYGETQETTKSMRIVADHIKAATFIIGDDKGVTPSNTDQGYIVRRLIRRAIRHGRQLGIEQDLWTTKIVRTVIDDYQDIYPELKNNQKFIIESSTQEEIKFNLTVGKGLKEFDKLAVDDKKITGEDLFNLYQTYGFPLELSFEELSKRGKVTTNEEKILLNTEFNQALNKHQDLSRTAAAGKFKGGLADATEETTKLHTAAHLLLAALRKVLGDHVVQKGSNITPERLRLDFSHPDKLTPEQIERVEDLVNQAIRNDFKVVCEEISVTEAKKRGAMGVFDDKYGEKVKVYTVCHLGDSGQIDFNESFSQEICGGPHVDSTGILGKFKIIKEESSSSGVRRLKGILEQV